jgi:predicted porin
LSTTAQGGNAGSQSAAFTSRTTNTIRFASDRMMGLIAKAAYTQSNRDSTQTANTPTTQTGGNNNQNGYQLALDYVFKKANVQAAYASFTSENPYTVAPSATTTIAWGSGIQGNNAKDAQTMITASYDFGLLKAYAGWIDRKVTSQINGNAYAKRTAQEIGVRGNWTPKIESWASIGNGSFKSFGASGPTANLMGWQIGSNYILSKRTNLYAIYGANSTSNVAVSATSNAASYNSNNYAVGIRHTF